MSLVRPSRAPRLVRGASSASVATFVALLSHVAGGGQAPGLLGIAVPWISLMVCTLLAGRTLSLLRLSFAVAGSQLLFHALFVLGTVSARASAVTGGHLHDHAAMAPLSTSTTTMTMVQADAFMWLWHGVAAAVTTAALYRGERTVHALCALARDLRTWARAALTRVIPVFRVPAVVRSSSVDTRSDRMHDEPFLVSVGRRGPPSMAVL